MSSIGLAVIGAGYWGPNLVRTAIAAPSLQLQWLCDLNEERTQAVLGHYMTIKTTSSYDRVLVIKGQRCLDTGGAGTIGSTFVDQHAAVGIGEVTVGTADATHAYRGHFCRVACRDHAARNTGPR